MKALISLAHRRLSRRQLALLTRRVGLEVGTAWETCISHKIGANAGLLRSLLTLVLLLGPVAAQAGIRPGFNDGSLAANDDSSTGLVSFGFTINFFGTDYSGCYVNNNGNLTFNAPLTAYVPQNIAVYGTPILAPFWGDVDTRGAGSGIVTYGTGMVNGHPAWGATWNNVGYYSQGTDKLNTFQVIIIQREDLGTNAFDVEFNYGQIQWDTASGAVARSGYTNGSNVSYEVPGSGLSGAFLDGGSNSLVTGGTFGFTGVGGVLTNAPKALAQSLTTSVNTPLPITLTGSDSNSPELALTAYTYGQPSHGTVTGTAPSLTYTPADSYSGVDSFTFTVTNAAGLVSVPATISIIVNDVPVAQASTLTTNEDVAKTFAVGDFQFTDTESDSLMSITISSLTLETGDTLKLSGVDLTVNQTITAANIANLVYTPAANANGAARSTFDFKVNDARLGTVAATMTINVTAVNDMPSFTKGAAQLLPPATTETVSIPGWGTAIDDGDPELAQTLTFTATETSSSGIFTTAPAIASNGTLTYTPNGNPGTATISVTLTDDATGGDAALTTAAQTFTITVQAAADYTVSTTGNVIVVTDIAGNSDTLAVSEPSSGTIKFAASGRTFSVNGGLLITGDSGDLSRTSVTGITVNAAAGADTINFGAFTGTLPSLTINGGTGDDTVNLNGDITFAANANLDVDLQNDNVTPGTDSASVATNANLITSGTGTITVRVSKNVAMASGSSFETVNGGIMIEANQQTTPTPGTFVGVGLSSAQVRSTGTGTITVSGKSGDSGTDQYGVSVVADGDIIGGTAGTTTVIGRAGASTGAFAKGVLIDGTGSTITANGADIVVQGFGGTSSTGSNSKGVHLINAGAIVATAAGSITVSGTAGSGTNQATGVELLSGTVIASAGGDVQVTGVGGGNTTATTSRGVVVSGTISAANSGSVTVTGTGGSGTGNGNDGILLEQNNANGTIQEIKSTNGNVTVTGTPGGGASPEAIKLNSVVGAPASITTAFPGLLTLIGDRLNLVSSSAISNTGGTVKLLQKTNGTLINLGGTDSAGTLGLTDTELDLITAATVQIGDSNSGTITVSAAITHPNHLSLTTGGGVTFSQAVTMAANKNFTVSALGTSNGTINLNSGSADLAASGTGTISLTTVRNVSLGTGASVTTVNGALSVSANQQGSPTSGDFIGIASQGAIIQATGIGNVTVLGKGGNGSIGNQEGVRLANGADIIGGTSGTVTVQGTAGPSTGSSNYGVFLISTGTSISSAGANVIVTGTGGSGAGSSNMGVYNLDALISATGSGTVNITGTAGGGTSGNGLLVIGATITSAGGAVTITAQGNSGTHAVALSNIGTAPEISSGGTAELTVIADGFNLTGAGTIRAGASGTGVATFKPLTAGALINLGGNDVLTGSPKTLGLTDTELDAVSASTAQIGDSNSGLITVSAAISPTNYKTLALGNNTSFGSAGRFASDIGATASVFEKITLTGTLSINAASVLSTAATGGYTPLMGDSFKLIDNDGSDAITGTFAGLAEGAIITNFADSSLSGKISYVGGDGNDVVVTVVNTPPVITSNGGGATASINVAENSTTVTTVVAADVDSAQTKTYTKSGADTALFNLDANTGVLTFATAPNFEAPTDADTSGVYQVTVTVTDNGTPNLSDSQDLSITVTNVNEMPVIARNTATITGSEGSVVGNTGTFSDPDGNATVTITASVGSISKDNAAGTWAWSYTPADGPENSQTVTITATDNGTTALVSTTTFGLTVDNIAPTIAVTGSNSVSQSTGYTLNLGTVTDPGADTVASYSIAWGDGITENFSGSPASTSKTHTFATTGSKTISVSLTDEDGTFAAAGTKTISVINDSPTLTRDNASRTVSEGSLITNTGSYSDIQGAGTVLLTASVGTITAVPDTQLLADTATGGKWRTSSVVKSLDVDGNNVYGTDGYSMWGLAGVETEVSPSYATVTRNASLSFFSGNGGYLSIDNPLNPGGSQQLTGVIYNGPGGTNATTFFTVTFTQARNVRMGILVDNADYAAISPTTLRLRQTAGGTKDTGYLVAGTPATRNRSVDYYFFDIQAQAGDVYEVSGNNDADFSSNGIGGVFFDTGVASGGNTSGTWNWSYTPTDGPDDSQTVTITANDGVNPVVTTTFALTVNNVAPTALAQSVTTSEDTEKLITLGAIDPGVDTQTFSIVDGPTPAQGKLSTITGNQVTFTPALDFNGPAAFTFKATDSDGADSNIATVTINVDAVNDQPVIARTNAVVTVGEGSLSSNSGTFSDADGNVTATLTASIGTVIQNNDAGTWSWSYTPSDGPDASQTVTITATDNGAPALVSTATFSLAVNNVAPTVLAQSVSTNEDLPKLITLGVNDPGADTQTFSIVNGPTLDQGTLSAISGNQVTFYPALNFHGDASFTFKATDSDAAESNMATVSITVDPVNDAPVLTTDHPSVTVDEDSLASNTGTFADTEGNATVTLTASVGSISKSDVDGTWSWNYTPADGMDDSQIVTITATDNGEPALVSITTFTLTVNNVAPTALAQHVMTTEDAAKVITLGASDPGLDTLTFSIVTGPTEAEGTLSAVSGNQVTFTPALNFNGAASFTFKATDSDGAPSNTALVTIDVSASNDAPSFTAGPDLSIPSGSALQHIPWATDISAGADDESAQSLEFVVTNDNNTIFAVQPSIDAKGVLTYQPAFSSGVVATVTVTLKETDEGGSSSASQTFTISMTGIRGAGVMETMGTFANTAAGPKGPMVRDVDGSLWGVTAMGGLANQGTVWKLSAAGSFRTVAELGTPVSFNAKKGGGLRRGFDGNFYITATGEATGAGSVLRMSPDGALSAVQASTGAYTAAAVVLGSDGFLYGGIKGSLVKIAPTGGIVWSVKLPTGTDLRYPLLEWLDGNLYGTSVLGGTSNLGVIFKITRTGQYTVVKNLTAALGSRPSGSLITGHDGAMYGVTSTGGANGSGTVFRITSTGNHRIIASFPAGAGAPGNVVFGGNDCYYGTLISGTHGAIYKLTASGVLSTLVTFTGSTGVAPGTVTADTVESLLMGQDGVLYGATGLGGAANGGVLYSVTTAGSYTVLRHMSTITSDPQGSLADDSAGNHFGTNATGGTGKGAIFALAPSGVMTERHSFDGIDGSSPQGGLTLASDGNYYGTTSTGGTAGLGTLFRMTPEGVVTTLFSFTGTTGSYRGATPLSPLTAGPAGSLYGTTSKGGSNNLGTVFRLSNLSAAPIYTVLANFIGKNGSTPVGGVAIDTDGKLFGTTRAGGGASRGCIYKVAGPDTLTPTLTVVASFTGTSGLVPGNNSQATLIRGIDGKFYGTTRQGGASDAGTVFRVSAAGTFESLVSFTNTAGKAIGKQPEGIVQGPDGLLYGTTALGGAAGFGVLFTLDPVTKAYAVRKAFEGGTSGSQGRGLPVLSRDGNLYGFTATTLWRLAFAAQPVTKARLASAVTSTSATLNGMVNANGQNTTVQFEFGPTPSYGSTQSALPALASGMVDTLVSLPVTGLEPHTLYHYRIVATAGSSIVASADQTLTTLNTAPDATSDSIATNAAINIMADERPDQDGDLLDISSVALPAAGTLARVSATNVQYTPDLALAKRGYDQFIYHVGDGIDLSPPALLTMRYQPETGLPPALPADAVVLPTAAEAYAAWAATVFPKTAPFVISEIGQPPGDPDRDGISNALECLLGTNPIVSNASTFVIDTTGKPAFSKVRYTRQKGLIEGFETLEESADGINWKAVDHSRLLMKRTNGTTTDTVESTIFPVPGTSALPYFRLFISL